MLKIDERRLLKNKAIALRRRGVSYPMIERKLNVSRSTLSGWLTGLKLCKSALNRICNRKNNCLRNARLLAVKRKKEISASTRAKYFESAKEDYLVVRFTDTMLEFMLAMLYLGEGFKRKSIVGLGNADPDILKMFISFLRDIYHVKDDRLRCYLHLRSDQDIVTEEKYWAHCLGIPINRFGKSQIDMRTVGTKTRAGYHGVCSIYCYDARIEKRLTALQEVLKKYLLNKGG